MKKVLGVAIAAISISALAACGQEPAATQAEAPAEAPAPVAEAAPAVLPAAAEAAAVDPAAWVPPAWAYPVMDPGRGRGEDDGTLYTVEGSTLQLTQTEINDPFNPPDWYPDEHPPMPEVVAHGRRPLVRACAQCHMPHGAGHPESSGLAALPAGYMVEQLMAYKNGERRSMVPARSASMIEIAGDMTEEEMQIAADYFASLPPVEWVTVIEATEVPVTYVGAGNMRHAETGDAAGMEPLGNRIIEIPEDSHLAELRDSHSPFQAFVPVGSVARGEALAQQGNCALCHGEGLRGGLANIPAVAGRSPVYLARQLWDIKYGARQGASVALMQNVVANLSDDDVLNLSAYMASLEP